MRASISEEALDFYDAAAHRTGHRRTRYLGMLLSGFALALANLPQQQRDLLERLIWEQQSPAALQAAFKALEQGLTRSRNAAKKKRVPSAKASGRRGR